MRWKHLVSNKWCWRSERFQKWTPDCLIWENETSSNNQMCFQAAVWWYESVPWRPCEQWRTQTVWGGGGWTWVTYISMTLIFYCTFLWLVSHFYGTQHSESRKPIGDIKIHPVFLYRNMHCVLRCSSTTTWKQAFLRATMYACSFVFWLVVVCVSRSGG